MLFILFFNFDVCTHCLVCRAGRLPEKGRVLFAVRDISALELVLVDPGTVVGPNYKSEPVCLQVGGAGGGTAADNTPLLQCLRMVTSGHRCSGCGYPVCDQARRPPAQEM